MPQTPSPRKRYCGLGNHYLRPPHKTITDDKILSFARHINPELRNTTLLCGSCYETLVKIYKVKLRHAIQLQRGKKRAAQTNSISDVSSSQQLQTQSSSTVSAYSTTSESSNKSTSSDNQPSTSNSAKRKRADPQPASNEDDVDDDDDDEPMLSLNAVNGTRLPNVQPIPKRRQFVHLNKNVMDIYLTGTTGG